MARAAIHQFQPADDAGRLERTASNGIFSPRAAIALVMICAGGVLGTGCQLAYFMMPDKGKPVPAEYTKINKQKIAVVVWADRSTLDVDPQARRRVCDAVLFDMKKNLPKAEFVSAREVNELQTHSGLDWENMSNSVLCKKLSCDLLLRIDLLEYTTRGSEARELRKGRVRGTINLYECAIGTAQDAAYQTEVQGIFPSPTDKHVTDLSDSDLLRAAITQFGQAVARKFYDHEETYHAPKE